MTEKDIPISYVFFWIALITLIILIAWRAFGSSPTIEAISFGITIFGTVLTWFGLRTSKVSNSQHDEQTQILKEIRDLLKKEK